MIRVPRAAALLQRLPRLYPDARCELRHRNPLELLVATILSAQCTDARVNLATPALFTRCRCAEDYASIAPDELASLIRSINFYRTKATAIQATARLLIERHDGRVPDTLSDLIALPGVGRKTANVVLGNAFQINEGVVVDTHVGRLARRLGLTQETDPVKVESALTRLFPRGSWTLLSHWLISHGRGPCRARRPDCAACELTDLCPAAFRPDSA